MNQFVKFIVTMFVIVVGTSAYAQQPTTPSWQTKLEEAKAARDDLLKQEIASLRELVEQLRTKANTKVGRAFVEEKIAELNLRIDNLLTDPNSPLATLFSECTAIRSECTATAALAAEADRKASLALEKVEKVETQIATQIVPKLDGLVVSDQINTGKIETLRKDVDALQQKYNGSTVRVGAHLWFASDLEGAYGGVGTSLNFLDEGGEFFVDAGIGASGKGLAWTLRFGRMWKTSEDFLLGFNFSGLIDQGKLSETSTSHFTLGVGPSFRYFFGSSHEVSLAADVFVGLEIDESSKDGGFGCALVFEYRPGGN